MKSLIEKLQSDVFSNLEAEDIAKLFKGNKIVWQESGFYGAEKAQKNIWKVEDILKSLNYIIVESAISNDIHEGFEGYCSVEFFKITADNRFKDSIVLNLTAHNLNLQLANGETRTIPNSANVITRTKQETSNLGEIINMPLSKLEATQLEVTDRELAIISGASKIAKQMRVNLVCIVSSLILEAMSEFSAKQFYQIYGVIYVAPNEYIRDENGNIVAIKSLKTKFDGRGGRK